MVWTKPLKKYIIKSKSGNLIITRIMNKRSLIYLNIAVLLFGLAGLFAKWIDLPSLGITFGRVFFSSISLGIFMLLTGQSFKVRDRRDLRLLICSGAVMAIHWWSIFESIQLSTVAIGCITFSTFPLFVTFIEPALNHERPKARNVVLALVILAGVIITVPEFSFDNNTFKGVLVGMISPIAYTILTMMNKNFVTRYNSTFVCFYEQAVATLFLLPFVLGLGVHPTLRDIGLLIVFGTLTTAFAHTLFISCLKDIPARLAGVCSSMETVYAIIFALILLGEVPTIREIIGAVVILGAVIYAQVKE